jgi:hypothetical protein
VVFAELLKTQASLDHEKMTERTQFPDDITLFVDRTCMFFRGKWRRRTKPILMVISQRARGPSPAAQPTLPIDRIPIFPCVPRFPWLLSSLISLGVELENSETTNQTHSSSILHNYDFDRIRNSLVFPRRNDRGVGAVSRLSPP